MENRQLEANVPKNKQAARLLWALSGVARLAVEELEFEEVANEDGAASDMKRLREHGQPHSEVSMLRAIDAVCGQT